MVERRVLVPQARVRFLDPQPIIADLLGLRYFFDSDYRDGLLMNGLRVMRSVLVQMAMSMMCISAGATLYVDTDITVIEQDYYLT